MFCFWSLMCILTCALAASDTVIYRFVKVQTKVEIGFDSHRYESCKFVHNNTVTYTQKNSTSQPSDIYFDYENCKLIFKKISHDYAGEWKVTLQHETKKYLMTVVNEKNLELAVQPSKVESPLNQSMIFRMPKVNEQTEYCLLFHNDSILYNVTQNNTEFLEPRYSCGVKMKIEHSRKGQWQFIHLVEGGIMYISSFTVTVIEDENNTKTLNIPVMVNRKYNFEPRTYTPSQMTSCVLVDPRGSKMELITKNCEHYIPSVSFEDSGNWTYFYHIKNKYVTYKEHHNLIVYEPQIQAAVLLNEQNSEIHLLCQVQYHTITKVCKFEHPNGTVFFVSKMIGNERYESYTNISDSSVIDEEEESKYCGLTIRSPERSDYGTWRCSVKIDYKYEIGTVFHVVHANDSNKIVKKSPNLYVKHGKSFEVHKKNYSFEFNT